MMYTSSQSSSENGKDEWIWPFEDHSDIRKPHAALLPPRPAHLEVSHLPHVHNKNNTRGNISGSEVRRDIHLVTWDSPSDPENPLNWPGWLRWTLICLVSTVNIMAGLSSSMFAPGVPSVMEEFKSDNQALGSLVVTIFVLGLATGPLVFAPLSELYGRTSVQHVGCIGFMVFSIACALSTSLGMLIVMRLIQGIFAAVPLTNGGGIIADMVRQERRGFAMAMFTSGTLLGPVLGPVAGGFLASSRGWRSIFWIISTALGFIAIIGLIFWRETYAPVLLERKAARLREETGEPLLYSQYDMGLSPREYVLRGISRPMAMLIYSPMLAALSFHMGLGYAYFYLLFTTFTNIFEASYHFKPNLVGLSYLGCGLGFLAGQVVIARLSDMILKRLAHRGGGEMKPEYRLPLACIGGVFIPFGFLWYGWTAQFQSFWLIPIMGTALITFGNELVFMSIQAYTIDCFEVYAASGLAANTVTRSVMAALVPLAAPKMYEVLGLGWGNSLLAFLALAMAPLPFLLFFHGERIRSWNSQRLQRL